MELIPFIYIKNRKITTEKEGAALSVEEIIEQIDKDIILYVLDQDGLEKDKPNLCTYPPLSEHCDLWVDAGPRVLGDIVDYVMAGATHITIRNKFFPHPGIPAIKELTENNLYTDITMQTMDEQNISHISPLDADGAVIPPEEHRLLTDFKSRDLIRTLSTKHDIYAFESDETNYTQWKQLGITGLIIELKQLNKEKNYEF
jgi:hypothetical protein